MGPQQKRCVTRVGDDAEVCVAVSYVALAVRAPQRTRLTDVVTGAASFDPVVVNRLAIARMMRPKGEELQTVAARLKGAGYLGSDANRV